MALKSCECLLSVFGSCHFDESEAAGAACFAVHHDFNRDDLAAVGFEQDLQLLFFCGKWQITDVELIIHIEGTTLSKSRILVKT
jgi:hypothetical protein